MRPGEATPSAPARSFAPVVIDIRPEYIHHSRYDNRQPASPPPSPTRYNRLLLLRCRLLRLPARSHPARFFLFPFETCCSGFDVPRLFACARFFSRKMETVSVPVAVLILPFRRALSKSGDSDRCSCFFGCSTCAPINSQRLVVGGLREAPLVPLGVGENKTVQTDIGYIKGGIPKSRARKGSRKKSARRRKSSRRKR